MKHITILVPNGHHNNLSSIVGAYKILTRANGYWKEKEQKALFKIEVAGVSNIVDYYDGLFSVKPHLPISEIKKTDLIIIPSLNHDYKEVVKYNKDLIDWITLQYKRGAEVAAMCTGAFLLAASGLLDGKSCSTHWSASEDFRAMFPKVNLQTDKLITNEYGIYTNGGAYSFLNLILYLVEKYFDRQIAILCSKVFQIEIDRQSQSEFIMFNGQKQHNDVIIEKAQIYMEQHYENKISIEKLSETLNVGRRSFDRRFIKATGITPLDYLQRVKVEAAKKYLESTRKTVTEVMYDVGYNDTKAFRDVFGRITGLSPLDYKSKYNKEH